VSRVGPVVRGELQTAGSVPPVIPDGLVDVGTQLTCQHGGVRRPTFLPFGEVHIGGAARLLSERHAAHRLLEPLLPEACDFERQVASEFENATGAVAVVGGEVVGYLIGKRREDPVGPHVWSGLAGHASREPELVRDLYSKAACVWVAQGLKRHFVFAPPSAEFLDPWFRLSFGASAALAIRETEVADVAKTTADVRIRHSTPADLSDAARFAALLETELNASPSFSAIPILSEQQHLEEWSDTWTDERYVHFVAERDGQAVGHVLLYHRPTGDLRVPENNIDLGNAATEPAVRGSGVGVAMTTHVLGWAKEHGYSTMTTDWRMSNLTASRFWPRRGFRTAFLRLYRSLP
jgi:GNAT superfamily N-acetyltransferase